MGQIEIVLGDITHQRVDAIVNAANSTLLGGGGVDGAIHAGGGPDILDACKQLRETKYLRGLPTGDVAATTAGRLSAKFVLHAVGPKQWEYPDGGVGLLRACHLNAMSLADDLDCRSIAFPAISCGVYGWKAAAAAPIAIDAVRGYWASHPDSIIETVRFVPYTDDDHRAFAKALTAAESA